MGNQEFEKPQDALAHYGVKGMRWGVIRDSEAMGGRGGAARKEDPKVELDAMEQRYLANGAKLQKELEDGGVTAKSLDAKYGPGSQVPASEAAGGGRLSNLSREDKIKIALGVAAVGAIGFGAYKLHQDGKMADDALAAMAARRDAREKAGKEHSDRPLYKIRDKVYGDSQAQLVGGLDMHWGTEIDMPAGTIFKRVSTVPETDIRGHGFFAAFDDGDVDRYKAILPTFWPQWGVGSPKQGGYVNNYKSKVPVKAPSGQESVNIFKKLMQYDSSFASQLGYSKDDVNRLGDSDYKQLFTAYSRDWAGANPSPATRTYFTAVRARGYNALIDFNDAGTLSKTPMRLINGNDFEISSHEPLGIRDMLDASDRVLKQFAHMLGAVYNALRKPISPMEALRLLRANGPP